MCVSYALSSLMKCGKTVKNNEHRPRFATCSSQKFERKYSLLIQYVNCWFSSYSWLNVCLLAAICYQPHLWRLYPNVDKMVISEIVTETSSAKQWLCLVVWAIVNPYCKWSMTRWQYLLVTTEEQRFITDFFAKSTKSCISMNLCQNKLSKID